MKVPPWCSLDGGIGLGEHLRKVFLWDCGRRGQGITLAASSTPTEEAEIVRSHGQPHANAV